MKNYTIIRYFRHVLLVLICTSSIQITGQTSECSGTMLDSISSMGGIAVGDTVKWIGVNFGGFTRTLGDGNQSTIVRKNGVVQSYGIVNVNAGNSMEIIGVLEGWDQSWATESPTCPLVGFTPINVSSSTLPVTWSGPLKIEIENEKSILRFSTEQEINNDYYVIEHSVNGNLFTRVGKIIGVGNSTSKTDYTHVHNSPSIGINYYRIKQIDNDGQYLYSEVASILNRSDAPTIYPNPVSDRLTIISTKSVGLRVYNFSGRQINKYKLTAGQNVLDVTFMERGLYLLSFSDGRVEQVLKK